jgi:general secretion pathway protein A
MRQLDQRISIRYELKPLTRDEVAAYVSHRVTVAGGSSVVSFQPKALDLIHRRAEGIPRLVNLLCDRALLAAYSARANTVTRDMVQKAAENLELAAPKTSRFNWFRRRAAVLVTAAAAAVSLGVAGGMVAPVVRAAAKQTQAAKAATAVQAAPVPAEVAAPVDNHYAVLAASFPVKDVTQEGSVAGTRLDVVTARLQALGYTPWLADVDLKTRGEWRRVLIGGFATLDEAMQQAEQLHQTKEFADAQPIRY